MDDRQKEARGEDARRLLSNELYKESWQKVREAIVLRLEQPNLPAVERESLNNSLVGLRDARRYLEQVLVTGTLAAQDMERKRSIADRILRRA